MAVKKSGRLEFAMRLMGVGIDGFGIALALLVGYLLGDWR